MLPHRYLNVGYKRIATNPHLSAQDDTQKEGCPIQGSLLRLTI